MEPDSFRSYVRCVWRHWKVLLLGSVLVVVGSALLSYLDLLLGHPITLAIVAAVLLSFLMYAMFRAWRDEVRNRVAQPIVDLAADVKDLCDRLDRFIETRKAEGKEPLGDYIMPDAWLTQISYSEALGRDLRHRIRIHRERLKTLEIHGFPIEDIEGTNAPELRRKLRDHGEFLADEVRRRATGKKATATGSVHGS
jgi:hypothetical protein